MYTMYNETDLISDYTVCLITDIVSKEHLQSDKLKMKIVSALTVKWNTQVSD